EPGPEMQVGAGRAGRAQRGRVQLRSWSSAFRRGVPPPEGGTTSEFREAGPAPAAAQKRVMPPTRANEGRIFRGDGALKFSTKVNTSPGLSGASVGANLYDV